MKNLPIRNTAGPDNVTGEFYQILKEKILSILHKIFQKVEEEHFPTHSNKTSAQIRSDQSLSCVRLFATP